MLNCGEQWRLSRGLHLPEAPGWALVGGSAVHTATEWYDIGVGDVDAQGLDPKVLFKSAFDEGIAKEIEKAPEDFKDKTTWKASGRKSVRYPNKEDEGWWREHGPGFVGNWINWRRNSVMDIWRDDDGKLAVELELSVEIAGFPVKLYIDRVMTGPSGLTILDIKSGANMPKDGMQLGIYARAVKECLGLDAPYGQFWDARNGVSSVSYTMCEWPSERLDYIFGGVRKIMEAGIFIAHPSNMCPSCGVRRFCKTFGGEKAGEVEQMWEK
jgi:putative RecB family exonuclease